MLTVGHTFNLDDEVFLYDALWKLAMRRSINSSFNLSEWSDLRREIELQFCGFGIFNPKINFALFLWWAQYNKEMYFSTNISKPSRFSASSPEKAWIKKALGI